MERVIIEISWLCVYLKIISCLLCCRVYLPGDRDGVQQQMFLHLTFQWHVCIYENEMHLIFALTHSTFHIRVLICYVFTEQFRSFTRLQVVPKISIIFHVIIIENIFLLSTWDNKGRILNYWGRNIFFAYKLVRLYDRQLQNGFFIKFLHTYAITANHFGWNCTLAQQQNSATANCNMNIFHFSFFVNLVNASSSFLSYLWKRIF